MSDGFIEITPGVGLKIDAESLTVSSENVKRERCQVAGASALEIARVLADFIPFASYGLAVRPVSQRSASIQTWIATGNLNNTTPSRDSGKVTTEDAKAALLYLEVQRSTAPPTSLRLTVEFSDDDGTAWYQADSLTVEFTDMSLIPTSATFFRRTLLIPFLGRDTRFTLTGVGVDATHTFSVELRGELLG